MGECRYKIRRRQSEAADTALGAARSTIYPADALRMGRITQMGVWLSVLPSTVNGTELGYHEWRDSLFLRYVIEPLDLQEHCGGCGGGFSICHSLHCKKECLITGSHNKLRDGVADLAIKAFILTHVRDNPKIYTSRAVRGRGEGTKSKGPFRRMRRS